MPNDIDGVDFINHGSYGVFHINHISDALKDIIRKNLTSICHGSSSSGSALYSYKSTLKSFLERYDKKPDNTKKGMIGEFISHLMMIESFENLKISSAFFNLEEKSIKKGFDLIVYDSEDNSVWITEVKSGNLHKGKSHDETTKELLNTAKSDLVSRLNEQETQYWINAINHVRSSVKEADDYKDTLIAILDYNYGSKAATGKASSKDKNVILVSNLFEALETKVTINPVESAHKEITASSLFHKVIALSVQKGTYENIVNFLRMEAN
ncbi:Hachiman antiphage defense system protein HamA [Aeromonas media]|uniref:Hachiman antiphage defense system protein HamA n=1 Tax=Aeromonas media TaxID=651 RepID=UPI003D1BA867